MSVTGDCARSGRSRWGAVALALVTGLALVRHGAQTGGPPQPSSASAAAGLTGNPTFPPVRALPAARVQRIRIPAIQVDAPVADVGRDPQGWIDAPPPASRNLAGWYTGSVSPGQSGTAVVVGHVDNRTGPGVFFNLGALRPGLRIEVLRTDGRTAVFDIYRISVFTKDGFPAGRVYADTGRPELRVITCGGAYAEKTGYAGNVVVFARMTAAR
ncbi:class F sortase [Streptomyces sp. NPDC090053]|uniref:class F sortase n=1 Tax=Streptomyces sp. NPDC090053 TaxID=3365932 RepID=UPI0038082F25